MSTDRIDISPAVTKFVQRVAAKEKEQGRKQGRKQAVATVRDVLGEEAAARLVHHVGLHGWTEPADTTQGNLDT